jgi:hypothetical protein
MKKTAILKILNPILGLLIINQAITGFSRSKLSYETFEFLHEGGGVLLICLIFAHIILNFNWIKTSYFARN